jgi:hypothetical protein
LVPNFLDPAAVARAWADEYEARQAAEQELARQRIPTQPSQPLLPEIPFISAWWHCVGDRDVTAGDLYQIISGQQCPLLTQAATELFGTLSGWTARKLTTALKNWSQHPVDGHLVLNLGRSRKGLLWRIERRQ